MSEPDEDLTGRTDEELGRLAIEAAEGAPIDRQTSPEEDATILAALNHMMSDLPGHVTARIGVAAEAERVTLSTPNGVFIFAEAGQWSLFAAADGTTVFTTKMGSIRYRERSTVG